MFVVLFSFRWLSFVYIYPSRLAEHVLVYCRSIIVMRVVWRRPGFESAALGIVVSIGKERHHTASWTMLHRASKACGRFEFCRCLIPLRRMLSMNGCRRGFYQIGGGRIATISTLVLDVVTPHMICADRKTSSTPILPIAMSCYWLILNRATTLPTLRTKIQSILSCTAV